jgi:hypothetical protein
VRDGGVGADCGGTGDAIQGGEFFSPECWMKILNMKTTLEDLYG